MSSLKALIDRKKYETGIFIRDVCYGISNGITNQIAKRNLVKKSKILARYLVDIMFTGLIIRLALILSKIPKIRFIGYGLALGLISMFGKRLVDQVIRIRKNKYNYELEHDGNTTK